MTTIMEENKKQIFLVLLWESDGSLRVANLVHNSSELRQDKAYHSNSKSISWEQDAVMCVK